MHYLIIILGSQRTNCGKNEQRAITSIISGINGITPRMTSAMVIFSSGGAAPTVKYMAGAKGGVLNPI